MRIVIPGGTGQVGQILARHFHSQGHDVTVLTANPTTRSLAHRLLGWPDPRPLGHRIRTERRLHQPRRTQRQLPLHTAPTANPSTTRASKPPTCSTTPSPPSQPPARLAQRNHRDHLSPRSRPSHGRSHRRTGRQRTRRPRHLELLHRVAKAWEDAFFATPTPRTRKVAMRSAITFSPDPGGVFDVFLSLVRLGLGGTKAQAASSSPGFTKPTSSAPSNS